MGNTRNTRLNHMIRLIHIKENKQVKYKHVNKLYRKIHVEHIKKRSTS